MTPICPGRNRNAYTQTRVRQERHARYREEKRRGGKREERGRERGRERVRESEKEKGEKRESVISKIFAGEIPNATHLARLISYDHVCLL